MQQSFCTSPHVSKGDTFNAFILLTSCTNAQESVTNIDYSALTYVRAYALGFSDDLDETTKKIAPDEFDELLGRAEINVPKDLKSVVSMTKKRRLL